MVKDLIALENTSKVWIYPSSEEIAYDELDEMRPVILSFMDEWTSHNQALVTYGNIFHRRFLVLFVDETSSGASGCSIDSSVRFIKSLGQKYQKEFFDRQKVQFLIDETVVQYDLADISTLYNQGVISEETFFFNNLVKTKGEFLKRWVLPVKDSWLKRFL